MNDAASAWVRRWSHLVPAGASVLDVACGAGRHVRWFAQRGCRVTGVDRDAAAIDALADAADGIGAGTVRLDIIVADIEAGPWPFTGRRFDAVVVTNYLWRALMPTLVASVADGGVLLYETFADGNQTVGKPANPDFLLRPGELLDWTRGLRIVAYEDGFEEAPARFVQRVAAIREMAVREAAAHGTAATRAPPRHRLGVPMPAAARLKSRDSEDPA